MSNLLSVVIIAKNEEKFIGDAIKSAEFADEILIWIPQLSVAIGSTIFFICVMHNFILSILKKTDF